MLTIRKSEERGHFDHGWLDTRHTFSFAGYFDRNQMRFRTLRVINEDVVQPGQGFGTHPHEDMEILTVVLEGALEHKDSMGSGSVIRPGDVQHMSAGTGVTHSEFNHSKSEPVHLLQIWILPEKKGITPSYEQKNFPVEERRGQLRLVASPDGSNGSLVIRQDALVYVSLLGAGEQVTHAVEPGRGVWVQVARGALSANGQQLQAGDGLALEEVPQIEIRSDSESEFLLFDLA